VSSPQQSVWRVTLRALGRNDLDFGAKTFVWSHSWVRSTKFPDDIGFVVRNAAQDICLRPRPGPVPDGVTWHLTLELLDAKDRPYGEVTLDFLWPDNTFWASPTADIGGPVQRAAVDIERRLWPAAPKPRKRKKK
jgi:hypothetical protein